MKFFNELLTNSHDGDYTKITDVITRYFSQIDNCEIIRQDISGNKSNIIVRWGTPELLINAHLDTVPPGSGWDTAPYELTDGGDRYYGLGTCDTKGNIYALYEAVKTVPPRNLMLLFSVDEESNSIESGVTHFLDTGYVNNIKHAIICEPTNNIIRTSHKGYFSFYLKANGRSGHSSETELLFDNAIYKLGKYFGELLSSGYNLGTIHGGTAGNVIAGDCMLQVSIRTFKDHPAVINDLEKILGKEIEIQSKTLLPALNATLFYIVSLGPVDTEPLEFWTEASLFSNTGIESMIYGVGDIKQAHRANEYVTKASLEKGIEFFINIINYENMK